MQPTAVTSPRVMQSEGIGGSHMTKEEWVKAQEALKSLYHTVYLKVDGYDVALMLQRVSTYKNAISIYIGGVFKGVWLMDDCEERRRFVPKKEQYLLSSRQRAEIKKKYTKRMQKLLDVDRKYTTYQPAWSSFGALKRHLIANNKSIELVSIE
jgi:hypothetical protein